MKQRATTCPEGRPEPVKSTAFTGNAGGFEDIRFLDALEADDRYISPGCYLMMLRQHHSRPHRHWRLSAARRA